MEDDTSLDLVAEAVAYNSAARLLSGDAVIGAIAQQATGLAGFGHYTEAHWDQFHAALAKHVDNLARHLIGEPKSKARNALDILRANARATQPAEDASRHE